MLDLPLSMVDISLPSLTHWEKEGVLVFMIDVAKKQASLGNTHLYKKTHKVLNNRGGRTPTHVNVCPKLGKFLWVSFNPLSRDVRSEQHF